jgi:6-phosphogluconolactonase
MRIIASLLLITGILISCDSGSGTANQIPSGPNMHKKILVGTYTKKEGHVDGKAEGVYTLSFDTTTGTLNSIDTTTGLINPSFLTISPDRQFVYVVNETGDDVDSVAHLSAFQLDAETGNLQLLNEQPSHSFAPCYISTDQTGSFVFVANYVGGVIAVYPTGSDGSLQPASQVITLEGSGPHAEQESSHPHAILPSPDNRFVYVPDKGADRIFIFQLENGRLSPASPAYTEAQAGAGPRHLVFHPNRPNAYLINELDATVNVYDYEPQSGKLTFRQSIPTLPETYQQFNACADIHLSPDGNYLYASNRGHNSIAMYQVDSSDGSLSLIGFESTKGAFPRNFMIDESGAWLLAANQNSDDITVFRIDPETGRLAFQSTHKCKTPVCLKAD